MYVRSRKGLNKNSRGLRFVLHKPSSHFHKRALITNTVLLINRTLDLQSP